MVYTSLILLSAFQGNSGAVNLPEVVQEAQKKFNQAQKRIEMAAERSRSVGATIEQQMTSSGNVLRGADNEVVKFEIKPAYHNWEKPTKYRTYRDYVVYLDYSNSTHVDRLQNQINQWLERGYYIIRSEIDELKNNNLKGSEQRMRIVK